jgi:hypothetical protein
MANLIELLARGLRRLDGDGRLLADAGAIEDFEGVTSLFVVDLEMSGPNAQMHEVLDLAGVRAQLSGKLPEEEAWGARVKPNHIGNAVPAAL